MKTLIILNYETIPPAINLPFLFTAASKIGATCDLLILGTEIDSLTIPSDVNAAYYAKNSQECLIASRFARGIADFCRNYSHVLMAADSFGKDLLPRVAGILDVAQFSEVVAIISPQVFKRPIYAGNAIIEIESQEELNLLTVRSSAFLAYSGELKSISVELLDLGFDDDPRIEIIEQVQAKDSDIPPLTQAKVVVSGGRSLASRENFNHLISQLAVKFDGAVGATRAAVEAGFAANDIQIGQTGQVVAPQLYIAVGISGAVQHIAGMKDSLTVVAINLDENAQIFEYADYGLVGDLFEIVPQLIEKL